jgi:hypothetical protein
VEALAALEDEQDSAEAGSIRPARRVATAEAEMHRLRRALDAGWDPAALKDQYNNGAATEKRAAETDPSAVEVPVKVSADDIRTTFAELGNMASALSEADATDSAALYEALGLSVSDNHDTRSAVIAISPAVRGFSVGVRGGTRTLTTRFGLGRLRVASRRCPVEPQPLGRSGAGDHRCPGVFKGICPVVRHLLSVLVLRLT